MCSGHGFDDRGVGKYNVRDEIRRGVWEWESVKGEE
jgi:hypothetical protein